MGADVPPALTWLVRHGQSTSNAGLPAVGHGDVPLTELGHRQARDMASRVDRQPDLLIVSPYLRARDTAQPILDRWPGTPCETWPIQELTYLSPARCTGTTAETRRPWVTEYWKQCDPDYLDGADAESFRSFMARLDAFHRRLSAMEGGFAIAVGHGQFFHAYRMGARDGFTISGDWMRRYRASETAKPMANCEIVELSAPG
jgi:broad specificity phosphatase PhoE